MLKAYCFDWRAWATAASSSWMLLDCPLVAIWQRSDRLLQVFKCYSQIPVPKFIPACDEIDLTQTMSEEADDIRLFMYSNFHKLMHALLIDGSQAYNDALVAKDSVAYLHGFVEWTINEE